MYDVPHFFLVANDINRYSLGDRTPGIVYADDGSLTITSATPDPAIQPPPPTGYPLLPVFPPGSGMYKPAPEVLSQTYTVPPHRPMLIRRTHPLISLGPRYSRWQKGAGCLPGIAGQGVPSQSRVK